MTPRKLYGRSVRRFGRTFTLLAIVGLIAVASASAFYLLTYSGVSGSGSEPNAATGGVGGTTPAVTANVYWGASYTGTTGNCSGGAQQDLAPGSTSKLCLQIKNVSPGGMMVDSLTPTVTTSNPSCLPSWFSVNLGQVDGQSPPFNMSPGQTFDNGGTGSITFQSLPTTDQSSCEPPTTVTVSIAGTTG